MGGYKTIQVVDPASLLLNGKPMEARYLTPARCSLETFDV